MIRSAIGTPGGRLRQQAIAAVALASGATGSAHAAAETTRLGLASTLPLIVAGTALSLLALVVMIRLRALLVQELRTLLRRMPRRVSACPCCGYAHDGLTADAGGRVKCPECGSLWRSSYAAGDAADSGRSGTLALGADTECAAVY